GQRDPQPAAFRRRKLGNTWTVAVQRPRNPARGSAGDARAGLSRPPATRPRQWLALARHNPCPTGCLWRRGCDRVDRLASDGAELWRQYDLAAIGAAGAFCTDLYLGRVLVHLDDLGAFARPLRTPEGPNDAKIAVIMPVYHEDAAATAG